MEVVEHVADVPGFLLASASLVKPGGLLVVATLNRTLKAFSLAIIGAEYVMRWLPRGTHDWRKFLKPSEIEATLRNHVTLLESKGATYNPLNTSWHLSDDLSVNYMMVFSR
jgi:2-polyprenyl-6-hydroxyphenyl methylase/3-demethylubiquinone-9 3-methyltransferase